MNRLLDTEGKAYVDAGLKYLRLSDSELLGRIERDPKLLRLPFVRAAKLLSIGHDEDAWKTMLASRMRNSEFLFTRIELFAVMPSNFLKLRIVRITPRQSPAAPRDRPHA